MWHFADLALTFSDLAEINCVLCLSLPMANWLHNLACGWRERFCVYVRSYLVSAEIPTFWDFGLLVKLRGQLANIRKVTCRGLIGAALDP